MTAVLELADVHKRYGSERALDGLSLHVAAGEIHALVGLNGAGKTTLMRIAMGMVRADAGEVSILGTSPEAAPASVWARVGQMIEGAAGYGELTVHENLTVWARLHGVPRAAARGAAQRWLEHFALERWEHRPLRTLSLGNRQRLGLACALVHEPELVVLDEPTNALDPSGVVLVRDAITARAAKGAAVLVSSHHLDEVARIADRISVIHAGMVIGTLSPRASDLERRFFELAHAFDAMREEAREDRARH